MTKIKLLLTNIIKPIILKLFTIVNYAHRSDFMIENNSNKIYYIPDIVLVGYGSRQLYQNKCLRCLKTFFCLEKERSLDDLFCDTCKPEKSLLRARNYSKFNYIGNIVGWVIKSELPFNKNRSRYNYTKVYKRDKFICQYCGYSPYYCDEFRPLHIDHMKPWVYSRSNTMENLYVACSVCNLTASDKWFENFFDKKNIHFRENKRKGL